MASAMEVRADSALETHRTSLLEVIEDKNRASNKSLLRISIYTCVLAKYENATGTIEKENNMASGNNMDDLQEDVDEGDKGVKPDSAQRKKLKKAVVKKKKKTEPQFEWPKKSYFEIACEEAGQVKNLVHQIVYIAKLKEDIDRNEVGNYHERLLKNIQNVNQTEPVTGLLLIYFKHLVHVMETSSDVITDVIQDLKQNKDSSDGFIEEAKILVISHDIPSRLYQQWSYRQLDIMAARIEGYDGSDSSDKIVIDLLTQILKLGNALAKQPKLNLKNVMDSLHEKLPDLLPQQAVLHYLLEDDDPCMISLEEYLGLYEKPYDVTLESELVWPLPTRLFPYN